MKKFAIVAVFALLAACGATPEEQEHDIRQVQEALPDNCELHYAGEVRTEGSEHASRIFYTTCGDVTTTSENHTRQSGKTTVLDTDVTIAK